MSRPQDYTETHVLLAVLDEDQEEVQNLLSVMTMTELRELYAALQEATNATRGMIAKRLKEMPVGEKWQKPAEMAEEYHQAIRQEYGDAALEEYRDDV